LIPDYRVQNSGQKILLSGFLLPVHADRFLPGFLKLVNIFITLMHQLTGTTTISSGELASDVVYSPL
jgi:hypothetical protein